MHARLIDLLDQLLVRALNAVDNDHTPLLAAILSVAIEEMLGPLPITMPHVPEMEVANSEINSVIISEFNLSIATSCLSSV